MMFSSGGAGTRTLGRRPPPPPLAVDYVGEASRDGAPFRAVDLYPSGPWRGYYTFGRRQHGVVEFTLEFTASGAVAGEGRDDVGGYTIRGLHGGGNGRVAFTKQYQTGTHTAGGQTSEKNAGHAVEYRGDAARRLDDGRPSWSGGVRGSWTIRHELGSHEGRWHLWPVIMASAHGLGSEDGPTAAGEAAGHEAGSGESECCVCYDRKIDTALHPCGHVALCGTCARRLPTRRCPLCRADIHEMRAVPVATA